MILLILLTNNLLTPNLTLHMEPQQLIIYDKQIMYDTQIMAPSFWFIMIYDWLQANSLLIWDIIVRIMAELDLFDSRVYHKAGSTLFACRLGRP